MDSSLFEEEQQQDIGKKQWEDFLALQENERKQPAQHEDVKSVCMKVFPKLAAKTNLDGEEL